MAYFLTILAHCPFCKDSLDELQAQAMRYSIYLLLSLIYGLMGIIAFKVIRMMAREERELKERESASLPVPVPSAK